MKTHVVQVEPCDDFVAVRDKLSWVKTPRLLLVIPQNHQFTFRKLHFNQLRRYAEKMGACLAIVTSSQRDCCYCSELGIPVFPSINTAEQNTWVKNQKSHHKGLGGRYGRNAGNPHRFYNNTNDSKPRQLPIFGRLLFFLAGLIAVAIIVFLFLPTAKIQLRPARQIQSLVITMRANEKISISTSPGLVSAERIVKKVEGIKTANASGLTFAPYEYAMGIVRFSNLTDEAVRIPVSTLLRTGDIWSIRFLTMEEGIVAGGVGNWIDIPVKAIEAGSSGNIPAESILSIEGALGLKLSVTNPLPMAGGSEKETRYATDKDRRELFHDLMSEMLINCRDALIDDLPSGAIFFPSTLTATEISSLYFPEAEEPGDTVTLMINVDCSGLIVQEDDIVHSALAFLDSALPADFIPTGEISLEHSADKYVENTIHWEITAQRYIQANINIQNVISLTMGMKPDDAAILLKDTLLLDQPPVVSLKPTWCKHLPLIPFGISVSLLDG